MGKVLMAAIVGGIVLFAWGAVSHMLLPLGHMGVRSLPDQAAAALGENLRDQGLYYFPGMKDEAEMSDEDKARWEEKFKTSPSGIVVFNPPTGGPSMPPSRLLQELISNICLCLVAAFLLARARPASYGSRVIFVTLLAIFPAFDVDYSYWNWYGFPADYTIAQFAMHFAGYALAGLAIAVFVKPAPGAA